jgi:Uncharacterized conserved protein (DUF2190)
MSDYTPNHLPGASVTFVAGATITGGQVVSISATGRVVSPSGAGSTAYVGVAEHDAASGQTVVVARGGEHKLTASGVIVAGAKVKTGVAGTVAAWVTGTDNPALVVGTAINTAADAAPVDVIWGV